MHTSESFVLFLVGCHAPSQVQPVLINLKARPFLWYPRGLLSLSRVLACLTDNALPIRNLALMRLCVALLRKSLIRHIVGLEADIAVITLLSLLFDALAGPHSIDTQGPVESRRLRPRRNVIYHGDLPYTRFSNFC